MAKDGKVINFIPRKATVDILATDLPPVDHYIWECPCGNQSFLLHRNGQVQCAVPDCGKISRQMVCGLKYKE